MTPPDRDPTAEAAPPRTEAELARYVREHRCHNADRSVTVADWDRGVAAIEAEADELGAAWRRAEAALPEGWAMLELKNTGYRGGSERWLAMASVDGGEMTFEHGYGDTKEAALIALAERLEAHRG